MPITEISEKKKRNYNTILYSKLSITEMAGVQMIKIMLCSLIIIKMRILFFYKVVENVEIFQDRR